jgi:hypothetical protein
VLLDVGGAELRMRSRSDDFQGEPMAARAFAAAMDRNQLGFEDFQPLFEPLHQRHQTINLVRLWRCGAGRTFVLWHAGHSLDHPFEATLLLVRTDERQGPQTGIHHDGAPMSILWQLSDKIRRDSTEKFGARE